MSKCGEGDTTGPASRDDSQCCNGASEYRELEQHKQPNRNGEREINQQVKCKHYHIIKMVLFRISCGNVVI